MKNILLIGVGRFGRHIAMHLNQLGHQVMAVDLKRAELLSQEKVKLYSEIRSITRAMYLILPAQETSRLSKL